MVYSLAQIAKIISSKTTNDNLTEIDSLLTDSRSFSEPSGSLFFALVTQHNDGHKYIPQLYERGLRHFVVSQMQPEFYLMRDADFLWVEDTLKALQTLSAHHRSQFNLPVIGITGSNGKTVVKEWLYQLLHQKYAITRSPRSYNSQLGVPLSVWQLNSHSELGIFEAGISLPLEMERLEPMIRPEIGILTNIGDAHQENFASLEEKCLEKLKLFDHSRFLVCHFDDDLMAKCIAQANFDGQLFTWSYVDSYADLYIQEIEKSRTQTRLDYFFENKKESLTIPFTDDASIENAIQCLATILLFDPGIENLHTGFAALEPVAMRLDVKKGIHNNILINDTYNSDVNSLSIALDFVSQRSMDNRLKPVLILSDILQSGENAGVVYQRVADLIVQKQIQEVIGIGSELMNHVDLFPVKKSFYETTQAFLDSGQLERWSDSVIL